MKKSKLLLVSSILSIAYVCYLVYYFTTLMASSNGTEAVGGAIGAMLVVPHLVMVAIALIFNTLGYFAKLGWCALLAGILYAVSILFMFIYALFVIIQMILCFVAFSKMRKAKISVNNIE